MAPESLNNIQDSQRYNFEDKCLKQYEKGADYPRVSWDKEE